MAVSPVAFAPYRPSPDAAFEEAARGAAVAGAEPPLLSLEGLLSGEAKASALALVSAGLAAASDEACRAVSGALSGAPGAHHACLAAARHRERLAASATAALREGFAGVHLDRPDAPLAQGVLQAGFCDACQRAFSRELSRTYGEQFMPLDYLALSKEAVAQASGAVRHDALPFGRDFWRFRHGSLERAVSACARAARDAARLAARPFLVTASFEAVGPAQLASTRHLDAAVFPVRGEAQAPVLGLLRLLRAALGRKPCAIAMPGGASPEHAWGLACLAAAHGVEVTDFPSGAAGVADAGIAALGALRRFSRERHAPSPRAPVFECALLYSAESDLWSGGDHRAAVERCGATFAGLHVQAPVVLRLSDAPAQAVLVLAGASALSPAEAAEVQRRVEAGEKALVLGALGAVDAEGRPAAPPWPPAKPSGSKVGKGTVVALPTAASGPSGAAARDGVEKALSLLLGRARRAASLAGRSRVHVALFRSGDALEAHLVALGPGPAQGATLFLGQHLAGAATRARFQSAAGADERIVMNPSGYAISTVLPSFEGYAVLSIGG